MASRTCQSAREPAPRPVSTCSPVTPRTIPATDLADSAPGRLGSVYGTDGRNAGTGPPHQAFTQLVEPAPASAHRFLDSPFDTTNPTVNPVLEAVT